jgi:hypothetical protein
LDKFDYVVIHCGFTARLVTHYLCMDAKFSVVHDKHTFAAPSDPRVPFKKRKLRDPSKDRILSKDNLSLPTAFDKGKSRNAKVALVKTKVRAVAYTHVVIVAICAVWCNHGGYSPLCDRRGSG